MSRSEVAELPVEAGGVLSEDVLAVVIGLVVFALALAAYAGNDWLGWVVSTSVWTDPAKALAPVAKAYVALGGAGALAATYIRIAGRR